MSLIWQQKLISENWSHSSKCSKSELVYKASYCLGEFIFCTNFRISKLALLGFLCSDPIDLEKISLGCCFGYSLNRSALHCIAGRELIPKYNGRLGALYFQTLVSTSKLLHQIFFFVLCMWCQIRQCLKNLESMYSLISIKRTVRLTFQDNKFPNSTFTYLVKSNSTLV